MVQRGLPCSALGQKTSSSHRSVACPYWSTFSCEVGNCGFLLLGKVALTPFAPKGGDTEQKQSLKTRQRHEGWRGRLDGGHRVRLGRTAGCKELRYCFCGICSAASPFPLRRKMHLCSSALWTGTSGARSGQTGLLPPSGLHLPSNLQQFV